MDEFTRSAGRAILDTLLPPIGGAGFLVMALFLLGQVGRQPELLPFALVAGFFGVLLISGVPAALRRGLTGDPDLLRVGPEGITAKGLGHLRWPEVAEVNADDETLTIRPMPDAALDDRFWAAALRDRYLGALRRILPFGPRRRPSHTVDFALLGAERDEVLDAIAAYRVVNEA